MSKEEAINKIEQELFELHCTCASPDFDCRNCKIERRIRELLKILKED